MKPLFASALLVVAFTHAASAQTPVKPKSASPAARPQLQTPADTANDMAHADRLSIQSDLAWLGLYNGAINGEVSERMVSAIKAFQKDHGAPRQTGVLNPKERETLSDAARKLQDNVGWKIVSDPQTGARVGLPTKLVPIIVSDPNTGTKWSSSSGAIQVEITRRKEAGATTAKVADSERKANSRKTDYSVVKPDFFVLSGLQGLKKFYIRGQTRDNEVRIMTILYDQATDGTMIPVSVVMSSAFNPFPGNTTAQNGPTRKKVEYSTGIVVGTNGMIIADREATESCGSLIVQGYGNAERIADDETRGIALLRIYGATGLKPLPIAASAPAKPTAFVTGISDPQSQGGRAAVSTVAASSMEGTLSPDLGLGLSGAAAIDSEGKFTGMARLKPAVVAGPTNATSSQAVLVSADSVREFLKANAVLPAAGPSDAKASVLRIICVRK
ncbi:MAG: peptidoglycan-binding protein [Afipia sp.]|nr:peptidoglycan-binding protein [Afipia sp.]